MDNNKVIIYTLVILLIAAVIFNPVITGNALSSLWTKPVTTLTVPTSTDTGVDVVSKTATGSCVALTLDECKRACVSGGQFMTYTPQKCACPNCGHITDIPGCISCCKINVPKP